MSNIVHNVKNLSNEEIFNLILEEFGDDYFITTSTGMIQKILYDTQILNSTEDNVDNVELELKKFKTETDNCKKKISEHVQEMNDELIKVEEFENLKYNSFVEFCNKNISEKNNDTYKQYLYNTALFYYLHKLNDDYVDANKLVYNKILKATEKMSEFINSF